MNTPTGKMLNRKTRKRGRPKGTPKTGGIQRGGMWSGDTIYARTLAALKPVKWLAIADIARALQESRSAVKAAVYRAADRGLVQRSDAPCVSVHAGPGLIKVHGYRRAARAE